MVSPSDEDRKCAMFDSFSKTASRNYYRDLLRAEKRRDKNYQEEPVEYILELLGHKDSYPSDYFVLYVDGHSCVVESETLYKALISLPEKQRTVLLLDFWRNFTDEEIAKRLEVTTRTVYNLRQRAYKAIRNFYGR
ncbi:MAG: sigma-70 family RNA polymerase sigma factor [Eubacteriales bacterium]|nr:sigma-70 family RNA polymerase sigma factor [Eubacteriales bacterium]